jgi:heme/copper-type cytochrome/quinol oxidase subunit 2
LFRTSTFDSFSLFLLYTCVPIVGVVNVILLICLSNFKSNFSASYKPMSMSLMLLLVTFITSDIPAIVLSPFNTMLISIASELRASSTSGFLYSVILYLPLSYTNITKYSPGFILSNSYFPLLSVVTFLSLFV